MKKKIVGIFVCMLMIVTALPVTGVINFKTTWFVKKNNPSNTHPTNPANSQDLITIKIVAKVMNVEDQYNLLSGAIKIGDKITGKYTYDLATPDSAPDPRLGIYEYNSNPCGIEIKAGGFVFKTNTSNVVFFMEIINDLDYLPGDAYAMLSENNLQLSNGILVDEILWVLVDNSGTALSSDALPTTAPVLSDWNQSFYDYGLLIIGYDLSDPHKIYYIQANVTKATKSRTRDVHFNMPPILIWLLERFPKIFPILRNLMKL